MKKIFLIFSIYFLVPSTSYAYLDPLSGSVILQLIIAGIAAFFAYVIFYYRKFKELLKNIFKKEEKKE